MKSLPIGLKITLWFAAALLLVVGLTYFIILSISQQVLQKTIRDSLIETVENNVNEVAFHTEIDRLGPGDELDRYLSYKGAYLRIDDDFLDEVNQVYTALYQGDQYLLYGENPISRYTEELDFANARIQTVDAAGVTYYVFDRELSREGLEGLWLRGVISEQQGKLQLQTISQLSLILLPILVLLAVVGGYLIARRMLRPIQQITAVAAQINQGGDLKKRIQIGPGKDELHQLADGFNSMFQRLDEAFEAEQQFTSDASHELRTPTSVILAQCEYILENPGQEEDYIQAFQVIQRQGRKMSRLINDMLDFLRLELRVEVYQKQQFDFSALCEGLCQDLALIRERNIFMDWQIQPEICVRGNRELLSRLLSNLVSNAYRYGREDGHIWVKLAQQGQQAELSVRDDGIGIAPEQQELIFRRFYQGDRSRARGGAGLGLSMAAGIAHFHQGEIRVESQPGEGSIFKFSLPLAQC